MNDEPRFCGARTRRCRQCGHRYGKEERELWQCPDCGEPRPCRRRVVEPGQRCNLHGGASLKGLDSPVLTHGRHSKYLPARLQERYEEALADPDLISLRDEIALLDTRIAELVSGMDAADSRELWEGVGVAYASLVAARKAKKWDQIDAALKTLGNLVRRGGDIWQTWHEIEDVVDRRRRLVEGERRRLVDLQQYVTAERVLLLFTVVANVITRRINDPDLVEAILGDCRALGLGGIQQHPGETYP